MLLNIFHFLGGIFSSVFQKAGETVGEEVGKSVTEKAKGMRLAPKTKRVLCIAVCACVPLCVVGYGLYCGSQLQWTLENGVLTLEKGFLASGEMPAYRFTEPDFREDMLTDMSAIMVSDCPWFNRRAEITRVVLKDGFTSVSPAAFADCVNLEEVYFPDSLTVIGDYAFHNCGELTYITLPRSVSIGEYAFNQCHALLGVNYRFYSEGDYNGEIQERAFRNCDSLRSVKISYGTTSIGKGAFENCSSLTEIHIPDSVTYIGWSAFANCSSLTEIDIPDNVTHIGDWSFFNCSSLTEIDIPNSVTEIGYNVFRRCFSLTEIHIPDSVTYIKLNAFADCDNLKSASVPANLEIKEDTFPERTVVTRRE